MRREKAGVSRVWVGAANQLNLDDIMGRYHSCVARMELTGESFDLELLVYGIDAIGNDQRRTLLAFGKKVAHGPVQRASHADGFPLARQQREGTVNLAHRLGRAPQNTISRFLHGQVIDAV